MRLRLRAAAAALGGMALLAGGAAADQAYREEIERWRRQREERLRADGGWLTVVGLSWLRPGRSSLGSAADNAIVLPSGPPRAGVLELADGRVTWKVEPGVEVTSGGRPVTRMELRPDTSGQPDVIVMGPLSMHVIVRGGRHALRVKDLDAEARKRFRGLRWFPVKESYRVVGRFVPAASPRTIAIPNVLGTVEAMPSPGHVEFEVEGQKLRLDPVIEDGGEQLFFIFGDRTSAADTYPAGRFLYADPPKDGAVVLDFNKAYSPPCAFTAFATCPLPPPQNQLPARIEAGELDPHVLH